MKKNYAIKEISRESVKGNTNGMRIFVFWMALLCFLYPLTVHGLPGETALELDGTGAYVDTGADAGDLGIEGNAPRTVEAWVYTRDFNRGGVFSLGETSTGKDFSLRTREQENQWRIQYWGGDYDIDFSFPSRNRWTHFALVHTGTDTILYADGNEVVREERELNTSTALPFRIGRWRDEFFNGKIAEVRVWNRALSPDEITAKMNTSLEGDEKGLVAYWPLNDGDGEVASEKVENFEGRLSGNAEWCLARPFESDLKPDKEFELGDELHLGPVELRNPEGEVNYQWYHNREPIEDATDSSFSIPEITEDHLGLYHVSVDDEREFTPVTSLTVRVGEPVFEVEFGPAGLDGISFDGMHLLSDASPEVDRVVMSDQFRDRNAESQKREMYVPDERTFKEADTEVIKRSFDPEEKVYNLKFEWGEVNVDYQLGAQKLDFHVEVINSSEENIVEYVQLNLLELEFPGAVETDWVRELPSWAVSECNIGGPDLLRGLYQDSRQAGQVLWISTQPNRPMRQRFQQRGSDRLEVQARAGSPEGGVEVKPDRNGIDGIWDSRPIRPGRSDEYELSLRFAPEKEDPYELARDVYERFGEAYPSSFEWADRRPVATVHVACAHSVSEDNPRGWTHTVSPPDGWSIEDEDAHEAFYEAAMAGAERVIDVSKRLGAQGVVVWQIEGMEFSGPAYYGEPRHLRYVAPEMEAAADDFFEKIRDAGLRVGITIRPPLQVPLCEEGEELVEWEEMSRLEGRDWMPEIPENSIHLYEQKEAWCALTRLANKIEYAKERWGATLFYLDTNSFYRPRVRDDEEGPSDWETKRLPAGMFGTLNEMFSDVMIIPEHQYPEYWAHGPQYQHVPGMFGTITPPGVRFAYPEAFSIITGDTDHILDNRKNYIQAAVEGDTFWGHGWWGGSMEKINALFQPAVRLAPYHLEITADEMSVKVRDVSGLTTSDVLENDVDVEVVDRKRFGETDDLAEFFADRLDGEELVSQRRVYVRYEEEVSPEELNHILDAVTEEGGIIAWSQVFVVSPQ